MRRHPAIDALRQWLERSGLGEPLLLVFVIAVGPSVRTTRYLMDFSTLGAPVAAAGLVAALVVDRIDRWRLPPELVLPVAGVAGYVAADTGGRLVGLWLATSTVVGAWALRGLPPLRFLGSASAARRQVRDLTILNVLLVLDRDLPFQPVLASVAASAVLTTAAAMAPPVHRRLLLLGERATHALVWAVSTVPMAVVGVATTLLPWVSQRIVRHDPTNQPTRPGSTWVPVHAHPNSPQRLWERGHEVTGKRRRDSLRGFAAGLISVVVVAGVGLGLSELSGESPIPRPNVSPVMAEINSQPWWDEFNDASERMWRQVSFSQWVGLEMGDVSSDNLNIVDGRRVSWRPPEACGGPPMRVWIFGGSAVFGMGERDAHTLPSALARAAAADGVRLMMENFGVPGDVAWQEHRRLERALETATEAPDLVIFFDGSNDLGTVTGAVGAGRSEVGDFVGPLDRLQMRVLAQLQVLEESQTYYVEVPSDLSRPDLTNRETVERAAQQYAWAEEASRSLLNDRGIPMVRFYQPTLASRRRPVPDEPPVSDEERRQVAWFRSMLPNTVVDIADTFDDVEEAFFNDSVHVKEEGDTIIARAVYEHLSESRADLLDPVRGRPCS